LATSNNAQIERKSFVDIERIISMMEFPLLFKEQKGKKNKECGYRRAESRYKQNIDI